MFRIHHDKYVSCYHELSALQTLAVVGLLGQDQPADGEKDNEHE